MLIFGLYLVCGILDLVWVAGAAYLMDRGWSNWWLVLAILFCMGNFSAIKIMLKIKS